MYFRSKNWWACTFWACTGPVFQSTVWLCTFCGEGRFCRFLGKSVGEEKLVGNLRGVKGKKEKNGEMG